jgi:RES domain-containing protein
MLVYHLGRTKYSKDLSGEGSRLFGARWNHKDIPAVYTSESRALALLEYTVNVSIDSIPRDLSMTTIEIPDADIFEIPEADLPGDWKSSPAPSSTKDFGTATLETLHSLTLKIPSVVIPQEFNYILNPLHAAITRVQIVDIRDFVYDVRIKKG